MLLVLPGLLVEMRRRQIDLGQHTYHILIRYIIADFGQVVSLVIFFASTMIVIPVEMCDRLYSYVRCRRYAIGYMPAITR